jgi:hypothetical protein
MFADSYASPWPITTEPAYQFVPGSGPFAILSEVGDLCGNQSAAVEDGFTVTRVYSNSRATGKQWPCIPATSVPYFSVAPQTNAPIKATAGEALSVNVTCFGDPGPAINISAYSQLGDFYSPVSLKNPLVNIADERTLKIGIPSSAAGKSTWIFVDATRVGEHSVWPLLVQAE